MEDRRTCFSLRVCGEPPTGRGAAVHSPDEYFHGIESQGPSYTVLTPWIGIILPHHGSTQTCCRPQVEDILWAKPRCRRRKHAHLVIPDTNVWHNFSSRDDDGMMQTLEEQELLSSIQELQEAVRCAKRKRWAEDFDKQETPMTKAIWPGLSMDRAEGLRSHSLPGR